MSARRPYVRPMNGWWLKNPFYVRYMIREATSIFVGIYALLLLAGLWCLNSSAQSWQGWLDAMASPLAVAFHCIALLAALYHTVTWFAVAPKVAPMLIIGGRRLPELAIVIVQYLAAAVLYLSLLALVLGD